MPGPGSASEVRGSWPADKEVKPMLPSPAQGILRSPWGEHRSSWHHALVMYSRTWPPRVCFVCAFFFFRKILSFCLNEIQANLKGEMCYFFFFSQSHRCDSQVPHTVIFTVRASVLKWGWKALSRERGKEGTPRKQKKEGEEEEQWKIFFLLLNSDTGKLCVHGCPFSLAEAWRQTEMLCQLQRKSMKMLFGSPFAILHGWYPSLSSTDSFTFVLSGGDWHIAAVKNRNGNHLYFLP